jgi:5-methylcytosine-specific restriction endonuclease McrA
LPAAVKGRDGHRCTVPGCATPYDHVEAHHIVPVRLGGAHRVENMTTLCRAHHLAARIPGIEVR